MTAIDWNQGTAMGAPELPATITTYLAAHGARDAEVAMTLYAADAVVFDDGHSYHGPDEIRAWLTHAASEYTYTTTLVGAIKVDDAHYDALHHLEGDFPGGVVDLHYRFSLRGPQIVKLVIEP